MSKLDEKLKEMEDVLPYCAEILLAALRKCREQRNHYAEQCLFPPFEDDDALLAILEGGGE